MRVYISNLGKYNEGELVGDWFTPPINMEEVKERIGLNGDYEEIAIHDYELPFEIVVRPPLQAFEENPSIVSGGSTASKSPIRSTNNQWGIRKTPTD